MGKVNIPKLWVLKYFMQSINSHNSQTMYGMNKLPSYKTSMGKHRQFSGSALTHRFKVSGNPSNPQCLGICKCYGNTMENTIPWKYSVESPIIPMMWFFDEAKSYQETQQFPEHELSKLREYYGNTIGKTTIF